MAAKSAVSMNASPRTVIDTGWRSVSGSERTVRRLAVMSSPPRPSPRVAPSVKRPPSYVSSMPMPSIFGSTTKAGVSPCSPFITRSKNSRSSPSL